MALPRRTNRHFKPLDEAPSPKGLSTDSMADTMAKLRQGGPAFARNPAGHAVVILAKECVMSGQDESMALRKRAGRARRLAMEFDNVADRERALIYAAELEMQAAALEAIAGDGQPRPKKDD